MPPATTSDESGVWRFQSSPRLTAAFHRFASVAGLAVAATGLLVLFGWALGLEAIKRLHPALNAMKPNTAVCMLLNGYALWSVVPRLRSRRRQWGERLAAGGALLITALTLGEYITGANFGIDQPLFHATEGSSPGRMAVMTASLLFASALSILSIDVEWRRRWRPAQWLALFIVTGALVAVFGYLYGVHALYAVAPYSSVALHTAVALVLLGLGALAARPEVGIIERISNDTAAGEVGRHLLPLVAVVPIVLGWLQIAGEHKGFYSTEFGTALFTTGSAVLMSTLTWWTVGALWRREQARLRFQAALANSEQDLSSTLRSIGDAVIATDLRGRITRMNPVAERLTGWPLAEARGVKLDDVFQIIDETTRRPVAESPVRRVLREGVVAGVPEQAVLIARTGMEVPIADSAAPIQSDEGELRGVVLVFRDLTAERRLELARVGMERALTNAEARNSAILASAVDAIIAMDAEGVIVEFNPAAEHIFGVTQQQTLGRTVEEVLVPESLRSAHRAGMQRYLRTGRANVLGKTVEMNALRGDGSEFPAEITLSRIDSQPPMFTAFVRDVTERHRADAERDRLTLELSERISEVELVNKELDSFAYVASHDLRSPLRDIANLASWILEDSGEALVESSKRHIDTLQSRIARMERLLDDLLEYSRIGRVAAKVERINAGVLIEDALDLVGPRAGFDIKVQGADIPLEAPRTPLVHAIRNLVANAIKHHDKPSGNISVEVVRLGEGKLRFTVGDDGPGIASEYHDVVFEPFRTLRPRDKVEGSGLGLAIVKKMVENAGGAVAIESQKGGGTRISFTWPERWTGKRGVEHDDSDGGRRDRAAGGGQ